MADIYNDLFFGCIDPKSKSRTEALLKKERFYFSGNQCVRGHVAPRYAVSGLCCLCVYEDSIEEGEI